MTAADTVGPLADMTRDFLDRILPTVKSGFLIVAIGHGPFYNSEGKYSHTQWVERPVPWPYGREAAVEMIQEHAPTCDVYICPYLMKTPERKKGNAAYRALLHCDVDGGLDLDKVRSIGKDAFVIGSGSPDHGHVYVKLDYPVTPVQHDLLERGLVKRLGGDPGKISENDVLRPPGTFNHKSGMSFVMAL
jgi:hypothetical protein